MQRWFMKSGSSSTGSDDTPRVPGAENEGVTGTFEATFPNFITSDASRQISSTHEIADQKWQLVLYPRGDSGGREKLQISAYVRALGIAPDAPAEACPKADVTIVMMNFKNNKYTASHTTNGRVFSHGASAWGWKCFYPIFKIMDRGNGWLGLEDSIHFRVTIHIHNAKPKTIQDDVPIYLINKPKLYTQIADSVVVVSGVELPVHSQVLAMQSDVICKMMYDLSDSNGSGKEGCKEPRWNFSRLFDGSQLEDVKMLLQHVYEPSKQISKVSQALRLAEFARKLDMPLLQTKVVQFLEGFVAKVEKGGGMNGGAMPSIQEAWQLAQIINLATDHQWKHSLIIHCESVLFRCLGSDTIRSQVTNILNTDSKIRLEAGIERSSEWYSSYWQVASQQSTASSMSQQAVNALYPL
eukprot:TRINITY_DN8791_c0_g1_i4.p2 TRINITY_DN8791_c0_g1~~TRINITY_DN8791_c0_g1_i4.p2  ORF type:complete len:457 (-),score=51.43 TRINITY_DN8791_c0_g1_i4:2379-3611(-)